MAEQNASNKRPPPKELEGVLFPCNNPNAHPKAPGHWGLVTVCGQTYKIAGWVNTSGHRSKHEGMKYLKLKLEPLPLEETNPTDPPQPEPF